LILNQGYDNIDSSKGVGVGTFVTAARMGDKDDSQVGGGGSGFSYSTAKRTRLPWVRSIILLIE
jgi:hypothetical protein